MKRIASRAAWPTVVMLLFGATSATGAASLEGEASLNYFLPAGEAYTPDIPVPSSVIGHEVAEQHVSHDRLVTYMKALAAASPRVRLQVTGKTYEGRELLLLAISSAENIGRLEEIRVAHLERVHGRGASGDVNVVALGYSVHGNEASGSNASLLVAYHLAASNGEEVRSWLDQTVVLIDPSLNPDGLNRFAQWVNSHRGRALVADRNSREHREAWPGGRTNHYWFDLNRDWLPAQHPESRARLEWFHRWRPHVLADFHEMGTDRSYFFQPGVPSRTNPLTPAENVALTSELARFHAAALDHNKALYYSEEGFDDFYYGKGSTYPDIHGSVGILFEQASARGHLQESINGPLGFPFAVRNQFLTSLSTLRGAHALRERLSAHLYGSRQASLEEARRHETGAYLFAGGGDPARLNEFLSVLELHQIEVYQAGGAASIDGQNYPAGSLYVVPISQPQYRMVRALFEMPTNFRDNTFYDVSAWTLPLAFGLPFRAVSRRSARELLGGSRAISRGTAGEIADDAYAWIIDWRDFYAGRALYKVLQAGARARVATAPFTLEGAEYPAGSVVIPAGLIAEDRLEAVRQALRDAAATGLGVASVGTGLTERGIDLGSPSMEEVEAPRIALVTGSGVNPYEAGEVWHLFDQRFAMPVSLLAMSSLGRVDLDRYSHLLMVDGNYGRLDSATSEAIAEWVRAGGVLVAQRRAARWLLSHDKFFGARDDQKDGKQSKSGNGDDAGTRPAQKPYAERDAWEAQQVIGGAIFEAQLDTTHPLGFGFLRARLPVFHRGTHWLEASENPFENVAIYSEQPMLAGYTSGENLEKLGQSVAVRHTRLGRGGVVMFSDVPAFRAFWFGTARLWLNAVYFGSAVDRVNP